MKAETLKTEHLVESEEFSYYGYTEERFQYWYGRHEHQLMVRCRAFIKKNPRINKCVKVDFVNDKENYKGKFVATLVEPKEDK